ncbi:pyridoxamine 5'-phosphate oxidase family protein [Saccharopolyspora sp. WRP15-2]|uniref:Pyridoxamine 5'-phosphate oxidase family protein n=1 Tax=Saccharopolyspora oryzae TaxID=2997343 RepID=A0ABT4V6R6_9PSEU|nr:pyridoxamine 5'-phosphate oxidase family protein [Saccharopolyspora oryzae]MDA3629538.1 pyridoxamine 5'-phosphate oxidase family protein [Saccharopolyspora oryzae]
MTQQLSPTERSTIRRGSARARTERSDLHEVLDASLICHLGVLVDGAPRVLPTGYGRIGDTLYVHGSTGARSLREAAEVCVTVTNVDGIVYARSAFHFSVNYRSAVIHGRARQVTDPDERWQALQVITEHLAPGSWEHARQPNKKELAATAVLALDLTEAAVKIRSGGPVDEDEDVEAGKAWAGVLPLETRWGAPEPADDLAADFEVPAHVRDRRYSA